MNGTQAENIHLWHPATPKDSQCSGRWAICRRFSLTCIEVTGKLPKRRNGGMRKESKAMWRSNLKTLLGPLFLALVFALGAQQLRAGDVTYIVGTCNSGTSFKTIHAALEASPSPNIVEVCPGTYAEQLVITKAVMLEGISNGNEGQVFITVPSGGLSTGVQEDCQWIQVCVDSASGPVNISNLTIDGTGGGPDGATGVGYFSSNGIISNIETRFNRAPSGIVAGILAVLYTGNSLTIQNSNLHGFNIYGIYIVGGKGYTVNIEGNTLEPDPGAETGIFVGQGAASLNITSNVIDGPTGPGSDCYFPGSNCYGMYVSLASEGMISNNTVVGSGRAGIVLSNGTGQSTMSVTSNTLFYIGYGAEIGFGGAAIQFGAPGLAPVIPGPVKDNIIMQSRIGIDFGCNVLSDVNANTISAIHTTGIVNVPNSVTSTNTYFNVPTIRTGGCP